MKQIAFLRGINVGGHNIIRMKDLVNRMIEEGFIDVRSYIQSGNLIFNTIDDADRRIESIIRNHFQIDTKVIIRTPEELEEIVRKNPFEEENTCISMFDHTISEVPTMDSKGDRCLLLGKDVIINVGGSIHRSPFISYYNRLPNMVSTNRNLKTILKMIEFSNSE